MKKILIIGFEKEGSITYPHLYQTVNFFIKNCNGKYFCLKERGYFLNPQIPKNKDQFKKDYLKFKLFLNDIYKLIRIKKDNDYDIVVAVDNLQYVLCSIFFKNTILWSHDFVTHDQNHANNWIQKIIKKLTYYYLKQNKKIIIQDKERLNLFSETYLDKKDFRINFFYFPVSLARIPGNVNLSIEPKIKPIILQIGGINSFRSNSDKILFHYQDNFDGYSLMFHGFFSNEMKKLIDSVKHFPIMSTNVHPNKIVRIVSKSDIGFISYNSTNLNFYNIKNSSGQFVEFLKCGKPIIVLGNTNLKSFVTKNGVGIGINCISEINDAIQKILANYENYSLKCIKLFKNNYDIKLYLKSLCSWTQKSGYE